MRSAYIYLKKNGTIISMVSGAFFCLIAILVIILGLPNDYSMDKYSSDEGRAALNKLNIFNVGLNISIVLAIITALVSLIGPVIYTIQNIKEVYKSFLAMFIVLLLYIVSIFISSVPSQEELVFFQGVDNKHLTSKDIAYIDGLLIYTAIMIFLTMCSLVFSGIWGFIKQR